MPASGQPPRLRFLLASLVVGALVFGGAASVAIGRGEPDGSGQASQASSSQTVTFDVATASEPDDYLRQWLEDLFAELRAITKQIPSDIPALAERPEDLTIPVPPLPTPVPVPPSVASEAAPAGTQATFHLCGGQDPEAEHAIAEFLGGRSFSATLSSKGDGCADLTLAVNGGRVSSGSSQSTSLSVSSGGQAISVRITSGGGTTQVSIGGAR